MLSPTKLLGLPATDIPPCLPIHIFHGVRYCSFRARD